MSLTVEQEKKPAVQREIAKKGPRPAILTGLIDIGMQKQEYKGEEKKDKREFIPVYTLMSDTYETEDGEKGNMVTSPWPIRMFAGATRGHFFDFCEALDPDGTVMQDCTGKLVELLGRPCYALMVHEISNKDGITYSNCKGVQQFPEDTPIAEWEGEALVFDTQKPDKEVFDKLWDRTKDMIKKSVGYEGSRLQAVCEGKVTDEKKGEDNFDDDVPF